MGFCDRMAVLQSHCYIKQMTELSIAKTFEAIHYTALS